MTNTQSCEKHEEQAYLLYLLEQLPVGRLRRLAEERMHIATNNPPMIIAKSLSQLEDFGLNEMLESCELMELQQLLESDGFDSSGTRMQLQEWLKGRAFERYLKKHRYELHSVDERPADLVFLRSELNQEKELHRKEIDRQVCNRRWRFALTAFAITFITYLTQGMYCQWLGGAGAALAAYWMVKNNWDQFYGTFAFFMLTMGGVAIGAMIKASIVADIIFQAATTACCGAIMGVAQVASSDLVGVKWKLDWSKLAGRKIQVEDELSVEQIATEHSPISTKELFFVLDNERLFDLARMHGETRMRSRSCLIQGIQSAPSYRETDLAEFLTALELKAVCLNLEGADWDSMSVDSIRSELSTRLSAGKAS